MLDVDAKPMQMQARHPSTQGVTMFLLCKHCDSEDLIATESGFVCAECGSESELLSDLAKAVTLTPASLNTMDCEGGQ